MPINMIKGHYCSYIRHLQTIISSEFVFSVRIIVVLLLSQPIYKYFACAKDINRLVGACKCKCNQSDFFSIFQEPPPAFINVTTHINSRRNSTVQSGQSCLFAIMRPQRQQCNIKNANDYSNLNKTFTCTVYM